MRGSAAVRPTGGVLGAAEPTAPTACPAGPSAAWGRADRVVARLLRVPAMLRDSVPSGTDPAGRVVRFALLFAAMRCLARYVLVPFGLPFLGPASGAAWSLSLAFDLLALGGVLLNLRRMWARRHPLRWRYAALAGAALAAGALLLPGA